MQAGRAQGYRQHLHHASQGKLRQSLEPQSQPQYEGEGDRTGPRGLAE